jgi:hypothetical protein
MKKLMLDAESLRVESFDVEAVDSRLRGTVQGHAFTRLQSNCLSCAGDCSSVPNACFCTEALSCRCQ